MCCRNGTVRNERVDDIGLTLRGARRHRYGDEGDREQCECPGKPPGGVLAHRVPPFPPRVYGENGGVVSPSRAAGRQEEWPTTSRSTQREFLTGTRSCRSYATPDSTRTPSTRSASTCLAATPMRFATSCSHSPKTRS